MSYMKKLWGKNLTIWKKVMNQKFMNKNIEIDNDSKNDHTVTTVVYCHNMELENRNLWNNVQIYNFINSTTM